MFTHFLKLALRNLWRQKTYSFINIVGLAIGMACFLLILFYVRFERSYDDFHVNGDRVYRVIRESASRENSDVDRRANTGAPLAPLLLQNFPSVRAAVRFTCVSEGIVGSGEKYFSETRFVFADNAIFDVFTFPLQLGNPRTALEQPFTIVLTPAMAKKYFGETNPIGRTLSYQSSMLKDKIDLKVTGVLDEIPANSHLKFDFLASYSSLRAIAGPEFMDRNWESATWVYVLLQPGFAPEELEKQLPSFVDKYVDKQNYSTIKLSLQPLREIYYHSIGMGGIFGDFGIPFLSDILMILAGLILLIACFNFMNLTTARSPTRSREIGVRKVMGADRVRLIGQFMGESLLGSFIALILALVLVELVLPGFRGLIKSAFPTFNIFSPRQIDIGLVGNIVPILVTALVVGIFAGIYPAFYLSSLQPAEVIKSTGSAGATARVRKLLVVAQFVVSSALITCSLVIVEEIDHMKAKDMGFTKDFVVTIPIYDRSVRERYEALKNQLQGSSDILGVTAASQIPAVESQNGIMLGSATHHDVELGIIRVDRDYLRTLVIKLANGRNFSNTVSTDESHAIIINEAAAAKLGWHVATGQEVQLYFKAGGKTVPVYQANLIGIVQDFNFRELSMPVQPLILKIDPSWYSTIFIRVNHLNAQSAIRTIETCWNEFHFSQTFQYSYLSDEIDKSFTMYDTFKKVVGYGTFLAVCIACLGLFGLASFVVERKTKEIGIRRTFGASTAQITLMLSTSFLKLVILGNLIAVPIALYLMNAFLQNFYYRIELGVFVFLFTAVITCALAMSTIIFQATKAALANPVEALRYE